MYSDILILAMLRQGPRHGYEIKKDIERALGGMVPMSNKTLYLALKHFEEMGAVIREVVPQEGKPNRHLYHLTERGVELLQVYLRDFGPAQAGADREFFTRVAFFDFLEVHEREAVLRTRLAYLQGCLAYLGQLQQMGQEDWASGITISLSHARRVLAFHLRRIHDEYEWIAGWLGEMQSTT
jgi:DNA-binding PadR family transcriptional regulator